jgi:hypothetical protein
VETGITARPLRHRQTKGAETDTPDLQSTAPHSYSTVKTIAWGMPDVSGASAVNTRVHTQLPQRTRGCGCIGHPAFPAPSDDQKAQSFRKTRTHRAARSRRCVFSALWKSNREWCAHTPSTSSWRRPGPIRRGAHVERRWSTAFVQRLRPGVMGPGLRQDDTVCVASESVQGWAKAHLRRAHHLSAISS